jgi:long-chain acyl-CoA synthetase
VLKDLVGEDVTIFAGVPTMFLALVDHPRFDTLRRGKLRGCFVGAASAPQRLKERFEELSGSVLIEGYGLTEAVTAKTANPFRGAKKPLSVGLPWPDVEMLIVDPDGGEVLEAGSDGELLLRSPDLMSGYWNAEAATAETLKDGWLHTGDIAHIDEDGYLFIVDRKKDLIICGGHNVYPTEIEEHLAKLPEVRLSCVVGIADDYMGEVPKAFIVLQPGAEFSAERARAYLEERLARYKVPRHYVFRDELPTSPIGKVLRKQLRGTT